LKISEKILTNDKKTCHQIPIKGKGSVQFSHGGKGRQLRIQ